MSKSADEPEDAIASRAATAWRRSNRFGDRHRKLIMIVGAVVVAAVLVAILWGQRDEFSPAISSASIAVLLAAAQFSVSALDLPRSGAARHEVG